MKLKTVLILSVISLSVFLIYLATLDHKVYYLDLGDEISVGENAYGKQLERYFSSLNKLEQYIDGFKEDDLRITDLIRNIETNQKIMLGKKEQTLKNALIKADLVTLSLGRNDFVYKIDYMSKSELYDTADRVLHDLEDLFTLMREYCKEDIIYIGVINSNWPAQDEVFLYLNEKINRLCEEYDILFYLPEHVDMIEGHLTEESNAPFYEGLKVLVDENLLK